MASRHKYEDFIVEADNGRRVCDTGCDDYDDDEQAANAHLIAAAPDMHDVLEGCMIHLNAKKLTGLWTDGEEKLLTEVRGAIDRAEGRG